MMKLLAIVTLLGAVAFLVEAEPKPFNPFLVQHKDPMYRIEFEIFYPPYKKLEPEEMLAKVDQLMQFYKERAPMNRDDIGRYTVKRVEKLHKIGHPNKENCAHLDEFNKMVDEWYESRYLLSAQKFFEHFRAEQNKLCAEA